MRIAILGLLLVACHPVSFDGSDTGAAGDGGDDGGDEGSGDDGDGFDDLIEEVPGGGGDGGGGEGSQDDLFSDEVLPTFEIEMSDDAFESLEDDPYEWVEATLIYEGVRYEPVAVRTKGENSWQAITAKPSLKVKLDHYDDGPHDLFGLEELTLQNMDNDYSMMHERVAYLMYRKAGLAASRATHAWVVLNGEDYGLYTHLETVDRDMIKGWYDNTDGPLFEQWDVDYYDEYVDDFELEFGEDDRTAIQGVADAMEGGDPTSNIEAAEAYISYDSFLRYWAVGAVVGQFDAYPYSSPGDDCHVYYNGEAGQLEYIPHGADETFYYDTHDVVSNAGGILAYTCRQSSACRARFKEHVEEVLDIADEIDLLGYHISVAEQIEPLVEDDRNKDYSNDYVWYYQADMEDFIDQRRSTLTSMLDL